MNSQISSLREVRQVVRSLERASGAVWHGRDDLVGEGLVGYVEAQARFKEEMGAKWWTFALYRVRGRIIDAVRKSCRPNRPCAAGTRNSRIGEPPVRPTVRPVRKAGSADCEEGLPALARSRSMESTMTAREAALLLARLLRRLSYKKRQLVIECGMKKRSTNRVSRNLGINRNKGARMLQQALKEIRRELGARGYTLADFV